MTSDELIDELQRANLRGRGGAGFPMGRKASLIDRKSAKPKYLVVNADESEPGAFKDRQVMATVPHRLIEGCLIAAHAIESVDVFIYIRGEYLTEYEILGGAVEEARAAGLLGGVEIIVHRGAGAYICGEETALLESLEGKRGQPRPRPPFPPVEGLYMAPTQINNVCTIATVPLILDMGAEAFARTGVPSSTGHRDLLRLGERRAAGQLRAAARDADAQAHLRLRRRHRRRPRAEGGHPGRLVGAARCAGSDRRAARLRLARRDRHVLRRRLADRRGRPLLHGAARAALDEVLHARVVRQVHAVPRGDALDGAAARADRGRRRRARADIDLLAPSGRRILGKSLCALGDFAVYPVASYLEKWRRASSSAHVEPGAAPSTASRRSRGSSRRASMHTTTRCTRESREPPATSMTEPELVTLTVDGREVSVPKGTGLVEAALAAGIEIPVFCYEPRLGAAGRRLPHVPLRGGARAAEAAGRAAR